MESELKARARQYFQSVYGGRPELLDDLADDDVVVSYPIFQQIFEKPALRGLAALKGFAAGFSSRWTQTELTFHDIIAEGQKVVLLWSFTARRVETGEVHRWGGMTLVSFTGDGKVVAEIGEESTPGPIARLHPES